MALSTNLVSYWKLDEYSDGSGAVTRVDSVGDNDLTDYGNTPSTGGIISNGINLAVAGAKYLLITDANQVGLEPGGSDFSISMWYQPASQPVTNGTQFLYNKAAGAGNRTFRFMYEDTSGTKGCRLAVYGDGTTAENHTVNTTLNNGTWYHIVFTWDASAHTFELYVGGSSIGTDNSGTSTSLYNGTADITIGSGGVGILDEIGYWSRILTSTEVTTLYNGGVGRTYPFNVKTINGLAIASVKTINNLAIASVKTWNSLNLK